LETEDEQRFRDRIIPQAVPVIQNREDPTTPLKSGVAITGMVPPSRKPDVAEAVYGVATWIVEDPIAESDKLHVYVRGLSNGLQILDQQNGNPPNAQGGNSSSSESVKYKTLRLDFARPGDRFQYKESEIQLLDPPYEWIYD